MNHTMPSVLRRRLATAFCASLVVAGFAASCEKQASMFDKSGRAAVTPEADKAQPPGGDNPHGTGEAKAAEGLDDASKAIIARTATVKMMYAKHVLLGWKELADIYRGQMDPRAAARDKDAAGKLALELADKLRANPDQMDALVKEYSEDPGMAGGDAYTVKESTPFVPEFKTLALRLELKEVGIVKTDFGYHVIMSVPAPPLDPLEPADILARPETAGSVLVQHVLIGWKDVPAAKQRPVDDRAKNRDKAAADKLAQEVLAKIKGGGDMKALMKEFSEDPGSKDTGKEYPVDENTGMVDSFKNLALRLQVGEAGMVKSQFGWHVMKRMAPPPPDALESADILAREPVTAKSKVKHILLSCKELNGQDPRAQKRSRAELDTLIKQTVAALQAKTKIEPLMAQLSEDPGSAQSGIDYEVSPEASLVEPFKRLGLRLNVGEVGVVKTDFGFHIIQRTE
jgi:parvulin-like peptidyl-prolyl isomerase